MYTSTKKFTTNAIHDNVTIQRNDHGVPTITASNWEDLCYGIGYAHAKDRLVQMMLVRAIAQGKASEKFAGTDELIEIDKFMRWINFENGIDSEMGKLTPDTKVKLDAYCSGINSAVSKGKRPLEFRLTGYKPEMWQPADSLITAKLMGYIGLAQVQGDMEKFLTQMIQHGVDEARIKALFPYLKDNLDYDLIKQIKMIPDLVPAQLWNSILPNIHASNNWAVAGKRTKSGKPILASDPHMEVNRLPAIWYESVWKLKDSTISGITMPGLPAVVMGRNNHIAWGGTYGFMDMIDYFIEDCRDKSYLYDGKWIPFEQRTETIRPKKKQPVTMTFYENPHGVLEGDPAKPGKYLTMAFSGRNGAGADIFNIFMNINNIRTVKEAQKKFRSLKMPTFNWVFVDREGNIGYQMNGKMPKRPNGNSGLLPVPGWLPANDWQGYEDPSRFPTSYNPESGFFATANNDLNKFGALNPINLPMAPYRVQRIIELLQQNQQLDPSQVKKIHYDLYSKQAERIMPLIIPQLPDSENGKILKEWDYLYQPDSKAAMLFESVYTNLIKIVFGKYGMGKRVIEHLFEKVAIFADFYGNFDDIIMDKKSPWFAKVERSVMLNEAIEKGLNIEAIPYGQTRKYDMINIFFDGKLPKFFGFDVNNMVLSGNRATIPQGQIFCNAGRKTTFAPSFRMIVEIEKDEIQTNLPGGPSGNRFSKWYKTDLENWEKGNYKILK